MHTMHEICDAMGGDPPCWAHLLDEGFDPVIAASSAGSPLEVSDLFELAVRSDVAGVAWSHQSDDLNVNLIAFGAGEGVDTHVNTEVDVLIVILAGDGTLVVDDVHRPIRAGQAVVIPKGARRALRGYSKGIAYLTCYRRRFGLWPSPVGHTSIATGDHSTA